MTHAMTHINAIYKNICLHKQRHTFKLTRIFEPCLPKFLNILLKIWIVFKARHSSQTCFSHTKNTKRHKCTHKIKQTDRKWHTHKNDIHNDTHLNIQLHTLSHVYIQSYTHNKKLANKYIDVYSNIHIFIHWYIYLNVNIQIYIFVYIFVFTKTEGHKKHNKLSS